MAMTEKFEKLKALQDILTEKYALEEKIEESPKRLVSQDELLTRLKKEYIEKNAVYEDVRTKVEHLKAELAEAEASRESGEKGMDTITTHREYEALDKQITEATERENSVRKDLQKEEKKLAELKEELQIDEAMISSQETELNAGKDTLSAEVTAYKTQLEDLSKKESEIEAEFGTSEEQEIVYKFRRIIKRNSEGIVAVKNGECMGCHMALPAQFANEVHEGDKFLFCPYCSRILFYQASEEGEEESYFTADDTGSLSDFDDEFADEFEDEDDENGDVSDGDSDEKSIDYDD